MSLSRALNVLSCWLFILGAEEAVGVACKPRTEPADLFAQAVDGLDVHVGLSDHLRHIDCAMPLATVERERKFSYD